MIENRRQIEALEGVEKYRFTRGLIVSTDSPIHASMAGLFFYASASSFDLDYDGGDPTYPNPEPTVARAALARIEELAT